MVSGGKVFVRVCAFVLAISIGCTDSHPPAGANDDRLNVNSASPQRLLARLCSFLPAEELCRDPTQAAAFSTLLNTVRQIVDQPLFARPEEFLDFVEARSVDGGVYALLAPFLRTLDAGVLLAWTPVRIPDELREPIAAAFTA